MMDIRRAEQEVLGCLLVDQTLMDNVVPYIRLQDLMSCRHQTIYGAMLKLYEQNYPMNLVSITEILVKEQLLDNIGGASYLSELASNCLTIHTMDYYLKVIRENAVIRNVIKAASYIHQKAVSGQFTDAEELIQFSEKELFQVRPTKHRGLTPISEKIDQSIQNIKSIKEGSLRGVGWGIPVFDRLTNGLSKGQLIIIAARPGVGKTAMMLHIARNAGVTTNKPVAIFSLEMEEEELSYRLLSSMSQVPLSLLLANKLKDSQWDKLNQSVRSLQDSKIEIDDTPAVTMSYIASQARRIHRKHDGIGMVIVDYLQLIQTHVDRRGYTRDQEIGQITSRAKQLAKELCCPVIMLCQLSRDVEKRNVKIPQLSDLLESGNIEQDADIVTFLYSGEEKEYTFYGEPICKVDFLIAKCRNGTKKAIVNI